MNKDYQHSAAALYDGGWRAADKDWLMEEYGYSEAEATEICKHLEAFESDK